MANSAAQRIRSLGNHPGLTVAAARDCEAAALEIERMEAWFRLIKEQVNNSDQVMQWAAGKALAGASAPTVGAQRGES